MRFVWAVLAFVLATFMVGAGIAQRTVFLGPSEQTTQLTTDQPQRYTMIDGSVLRSQPGEQTLEIEGEGPVFLAVARTLDVEGWLSDTSYTRFSVDEDGEVSFETVAPTFVPPTEGDEGEAAAESEDAESADADAPGRDPAGSDLWLEEYDAEGALTHPMQLPEGLSLLVASDGTSPAPSKVSVTWPLDNSTPWAGPLMVGGAVLMVVGVILYVNAVRHVRRGRGPRRKGPPPLPPTEPISISGDGFEDEASSLTPTSRGSSRRGRRRRNMLAVPALGLSAVLLAGCTADSWPQFAEEPTPSPSATVVAPENQQSPSLTESQAERILAAAAEVVAAADEARDADLLATRMDGPALKARKTNYLLRDRGVDAAAPVTLPASTMRILVPQAFDAWPRTTMMLVSDGDDETIPPVVLTMSQADPWSDYKVSYLAEMQAAAELPDLPPAWMGAKLTPPDSPFLVMPPGELAAAFADVIDEGEDSDYRGMFGKTAIAFADTVNASRATVAKNLAEAGAAETSKVTSVASAGPDDPIALAGIDSGAVVAVTLRDVQSVRPTTSDAVIRPPEKGPEKALTGLDESATGFEDHYGMQLFFAVPAQGSSAQIQLLAVSQELLMVKEIKK